VLCEGNCAADEFQRADRLREMLKPLPGTRLVSTSRVARDLESIPVLYMSGYRVNRDLIT
jgi:hypothetical protein